MFQVPFLPALALFTGLVIAYGHAQTQVADTAQQKVSVQTTALDSLQSGLANLDQHVKILERLRDVDAEVNQKKSDESPVVGAGKDGFTLRAPDTSYQLRIRYEGHVDGRAFLNSDTFTTQRTAAFLVRRARPILEARVPGPFVFRLLADIAGSKVDILDAYVESNFDPRFGIRIGKFKSPLSLEVLQSTTAAHFIESSLSSQLAPNRDIGGQLQGDINNGVLTYAIGVFDGVTDGTNLDADWNRKKDIAARVFSQPLQSISILKGFGVGASFTYGDHNDLRKWVSGQLPASVPGFKSAGQESFFKYRDSVYVSGIHSRYDVQGYYYIGAFGLLGEYINSTSKLKRRTSEETIANSGWNIGASYVLTQEANSFKGLKPFRNFNLFKGQLGAFELAARVSKLSIDNKAFPFYADSTKSARNAIDYTGGINWHLNKNVKILVNYTQTVFKSGSTNGKNIPDEQVVAGRFQLAF